jgi:fatty acid desaturase
MGPTRKRDLTVVIVLVAAIAYLVSVGAYPQWFPPITLLTGISLLGVAACEAAWGRYVRSKINDGEIGDGSGRLHPLAVARTVWIAKASAWVGALMVGWWLGLLAYLLPHRGWLRAAGEDTPGTVVAAASALALVVAALWLQHCCEKPEEPPDSSNQAPSD